MTLLGTEPANFHFLTQCLIQRSHHVGPEIWMESTFISFILTYIFERIGCPLFCFTRLPKSIQVQFCLIRLGTHYPHVTWAQVMLRVHFNYLTLNSGADSHFCQICLRHVNWSGALVRSRASTTLKFLLSHTFRETWRTCRVLFNIVTSCFQKWRKCLLKKVLQRTFLYDTKSPDYRDQHKTANAWEERAENKTQNVTRG
jgi:hypothetical protein